MSREPVAWDGTWEHSTEPGVRLPASKGPWRTEEEARAFEERFPKFKAEAVPLYAEPPELGELVAALQDSNAMLEELTRSEENSEDGITWTVGAIDAQLADNRTALARYEDKGGTDE